MYVLTAGAKEKFIGRLGEKCLDILNEFLNIIINYEKENTTSLQSFLEWFKSSEHTIKRESFADKNAVRLMTVHASKGLQSPFVILADAAHYGNKKDDLLKRKDGFLLCNISSNRQPQEIKQLYEDRQLEKDDEYYRLLYVAMTRAEDFLYVLGEKGKQSLNEKCWYNLIRQKS